MDWSKRIIFPQLSFVLSGFPATSLSHKLRPRIQRKGSDPGSEVRIPGRQVWGAARAARPGWERFKPCRRQGHAAAGAAAHPPHSAPKWRRKEQERAHRCRSPPLSPPGLSPLPLGRAAVQCAGAGEAVNPAPSPVLRACTCACAVGAGEGAWLLPQRAGRNCGWGVESNF